MQEAYVVWTRDQRGREREEPIGSFSLWFAHNLNTIIRDKTKVRFYRVNGRDRVLIAAVDWNGLQVNQLPLV